jgi:hypothetical protein
VRRAAAGPTRAERLASGARLASASPYGPTALLVVLGLDRLSPEPGLRLEHLFIGDPCPIAAEERRNLVHILASLALSVVEDPDYLVVKAADGAERSHEAYYSARGLREQPSLERGAGSLDTGSAAGRRVGRTTGASAN